MSMKAQAVEWAYAGSETIVAADGTLDGEDVLPGFSCRLASLL